MATFTRTVGDGATLRRLVAFNDRTMRDPRALRAAIIIGESASITDATLAESMLVSTGSETAAGALDILRAIAATGAGTVE